MAIDFDAIGKAALASSSIVLSHWLPDGKRSGAEWLARNPRRTDRSPGSFSVNVETGRWCDFATGDKGGDLVSLVAYLKGVTQTDAADELSRFLGLNGHAPKAPDRPRDKPSPEAKPALTPIPPEALASRPTAHGRHGAPSAEWCYRDAEGRPLFYVLRFDPPEGRKQFAPLVWDGSRWQWKAPAAPRPLYGLDRLAARPDAPVVVTEGEKAADAAAELLPDHVAVASMNGAQSPSKTDWSPLNGRHVTIWPDADEPGATYAATVADLLRKIGAASIAVIDPALIRQGLPDGWDAADALAEGIDADAILAATPKPEAEKKGFSPYRVKEWEKGLRNGVYYCPDTDEDPFFICDPLHVTARTRDEHGRAWGYLLEWADPDGQPHQWAMPAELLSGDGAELRSILLDGGLHIDPRLKARPHLATYIATSGTKARARCTSRTGWHGPAFVLPDRVIGGQPDEKVIFQSTSGAVNRFATAGTLEGWKKHVAAPSAGNSRLVFPISTALSSLLVEIVGDESGGFHFKGESSIGKTVSVAAAASVFGGSDYLHRWRTTANGLEAIAASHSGALLVLDEIGQADGKEAGDAIYMLANGTGKHRADRTGGARRAARWSLLILSSGEIDLVQHMASAGRRAQAGQEVRLLTIEADAGRGYGVFEDLRGHSDGAAFATALTMATHTYYGTAGIAFIEEIARNLKAVPSIVDGARRAFIEAHLPVGASGQVHRAIGRFALVAAGGELATQCGITGWQPGEASRAAAVCFQAWLDGRGGAGNREATAILAQVRRFIENHGEARFHNWDRPEERPIINRAGVRRQDEDGWTYFILPETFKAELCAGFDPRLVTKVLDDAGLLVRDKAGKSSTNHRLPGIGLSRCYQVRAFGESDT